MRNVTRFTRSLLLHLVAGMLLVPVAWAQDISPTSLAFGQVEFGESRTLSVRITNNFTSPMSFDEAFIEDPNVGDTPPKGEAATDFSVANPGAQSIAPGESLTIPVTFTPSFLGPQTGTLVIRTFQEVEDRVPLTGTGIFPGIGIGPSAVDFGAVGVGGSRDRGVTITNTANVAVVFDEAFIEGSSDFSVVDLGVTTLDPGASVTIPVEFSPTIAGVQLADLVIVIVLPTLEEFREDRVPLRGEGIAPAPDIAVTPLELSFGEVEVDEAAVLDLTVLNDGAADLTVTGFEVVGDADGAFSIPGGGFVLGPDQERDVAVTFRPPGIGLFDAVIRVSSNDPGEPVIDRPVSGIGAPPPEALDFGDVQIGQSETLTVDIMNPGLTSLDVTVRIVDDPTGSYSVVPLAFQLPPQASRSLAVTFTPQQRGAGSATLLVESQAPTFIFLLSGTGTAPRIRVDEVLDFGLVPVGLPATQSVEIRNEGDAPLTVFGATIGGGDGQFVVTGGGGQQSIPPGGSHTVAITFTPNAEGPHMALLRLPNDDPDQPEATVALSGEGACGLTLSEQAIDFGDAVVGQPVTRDVVLGHTCAMTIDVQVSLSGSADFSISEGDALILIPNATPTITVTFTPSRGAQSATLRFEIDTPAFSFVEVGLTGRGVEPDITLSRTSLDFGVTTVGRTASRSFRVTNAGTAPLNLASLSIGGPGAAAFQLEDDSPSVMEAFGRRTVTVFFTPGTVGDQTAAVRLESDDPDSPQLDVQLSGRGAAIQNQTPAVADENTAVQSVFILPDDLRGAAGQLFYRMGGQESFQSVPLAGEGNTYRAPIPASAVTIRGVEYFASFVEGTETFTFPAQGAAHIQVRAVTAVAGGAFLPVVYRMVSIPLDLQDQTLVSIFIGAYGPTDPNVWRALRWDGDEYIELGIDLSGIRALPGLAFWLITRDGLGFEVEGGRSIPTDEPYLITLRPGWNQIGGPFPFAVAWNQVVGRENVQGPFAFDGQYIPNQATLQPWEGYFVFNPTQEVITLLVRPVEAAAAKQAASEPLFADEAYVLQLRAELPEHGLLDTHNYLGFAEQAAARTLELNLPEPPAMGDHLRLSILNGAERLISHFEAPGATGRQWDLELTAVLEGELRFRQKTVTVSLAEYGQRPEGFDLYVLDRDQGRVLPVEAEHVTVDLTLDRPVRHLSVIVGTEAFAEAHSDGVSLVPVDFVLEQNYPNPFNPETVIRYGLSEQSHVTLDVYNLLGQRVRTLVEAEQTSGRYAVTWDSLDDRGRPVASGLYVYQLRAGDFRTSRKMLLMR